MEPENIHLIPTDQWNKLGEQKEAFNQVYGKVMKQKDQLIADVPADQRTSQFTSLLDQLIMRVCVTAVQELHHA